MSLFSSNEMAPKFVRGTSAQSLQALLLKEQRRNKNSFVKIISIYFDGKYHYGWFYHETNLTEEIINKGKENELKLQL